MCGEVAEFLRRQVLEDVALGFVHLRRHAVDAAVDVRDQDDAVAGAEQVHDRRHRAEAGRERDPVLCRLERGETELQRGACGIGDACVVVALVLADRLLFVRRRLVDRNRHRTRRGIRLLAFVDRARLKVHRYCSMLAAPSQRARSRNGRCNETGLTPLSHHRPFTRRTLALRSKTGSIRPMTRSPRSTGST